MGKAALAGIVLVIAVLAGVSLRPDDGTPLSITPPDAASSVSGTSHTEPLPRIPRPADLLRAFALVALVVLAAAARPAIAPAWRTRVGERLRSLLWSSSRSRRGPPLLA
jgi:hypothetical protein